jgi:filamentous hemagglutinin
VKSDYASVNEQSGLNAGDGGFQINVAKNTDLKGGIISSNDKAVAENKNSLTTATLTTSDINNHADYKASSVSVSVGTDAGGVNISGAGAGFDKGSASGTTKSAISSANVTITDDAKQQELSGKTSQETIASINTDTTNANQKVNQIFDAAKVTDNVQATAQIMQSFTQYAPKAVADYASAKANELRKEGKEEEAKKWDEGGAYRVALHTVSGALAGGVGGAIGSATVASSAPILESFQNSTTQALIDAGMSSDSAATIASGLTSITATGMGALAGSATGEAGTLNGAATAYTTDANNRQLHNQEIRWIKNHAKEYAQKTGLTPEQAEALLTKAAMYYVDDASSDALTQKQKDAGFLSLNPYAQSQYAQAYSYMRANSKGEYFTDVYNQDKITRQPLFTATQAQYANSSYNPNQSQGLVDQSWVMLPIGKGLKESSKVAFEGGKVVSPTLTNGYYGTMNFLYDPYNSAKIIGGIEVANDVFNPSMPPSTNIGYWYFLYDNLKNNTNTIYEAVSK